MQGTATSSESRSWLPTHRRSSLRLPLRFEERVEERVEEGMVAAALRIDPSRGLIRGARAAVLTVPAVGAAAATHSLVDGCASWVAVGLAAGLCWPSAVAVVGARRRLGTLLMWVAAAQVVTHLLLELTCPEVVSGQVSLARHLRGSLTPEIVAAHVTCALVTAVLLRRADAALWAAHKLLRAAWRLARAFMVPRPSPVVRDRAEVPAPGVELVTDLWRAPRPVRRGPPALSLR